MSEETAEYNISMEDAGSLFAADLEPVRFDIPEGLLLPGSWVELKPMDGYAYERYLESGQIIRITGQEATTATADVHMDSAEQHLRLMMATITGWSFVIKKAVRNSPGEFVNETMLMPAEWRLGAAVPTNRANKEREFESFLKRLKKPLWNWLVARCQETNGLDTVALGN